MLVMFLSSLYQAKVRQRRKKSGISQRNSSSSSSIMRYCLKILSLCGILVNTILTLPIFNVYISTIICKSESSINANTQCYSGAQIAHMVLAIIGLLIYFFFCILFNLFLIELNPFSKAPFAAPQSKSNFLRTVLKFVLPLYTTLDVAFSA